MSVILPGGCSGVIKAGSAVFSPDSLAGLILWLDAGVGTYSDTAMTTPQTTNAGAVAGWSSRTGSNHVTQGTGTAQPTLRTAVLNGRSVLRFDGGDWLQSAALGATDNAPNTLFAVSLKRLNDSVLQYALHGRVATANIQRQTLGYHNASNIFRFSGSSSITKAGTVTVFSILAGLMNAASSKVWVNGGVGTTGTTGSVGLSGFTIGAEADGTVGLDGDIAEVLVYSGGLTESEINSVIAYLGSKYNITVTTVS